MLVTVVALCALVLAYVALVAAWLALRTLGRVRRASTVLGRDAGRGTGDPEETLLEATARHARLAEQVAVRLDEVQAELEQTRRGVAARSRTGERGVSEALDAVRRDVATSLRRVALVRYDAFGDNGGRLSFSLALLDDTGDGVTLSSIAGRTETRLYAKGVQHGVGERELSPEETQAVRAAMRDAAGPSVAEAS